MHLQTVNEKDRMSKFYIQTNFIGIKRLILNFHGFEYEEFAKEYTNMSIVHFPIQKIYCKVHC